MKNKDFDFDFDMPEESAKKISFNDLDLGLDFDLSFLDDAEDPVADSNPEPKPEPRPEPKAAPRPAPKQQPRSAAPQQKPAQRPAAQQGAQQRKAPQPNRGTASQQMPPVRPNAPAKAQTPPPKRPQPPVQQPVQEAPKKRGPRVGGVIFYTLYFILILVFFGAVFLGLNWLKGWLQDYEYAQPTVKAEQVFQDVFTNPDWAALYDSAGAEDSLYEGKEQYVAYMEAKCGSTPLTYMETSAGLSGNKKFLVYLNDEKVASFTLVDKNKVEKVNLQDINMDNLENIADIPDWQLGAVEIFFERKGDYLIEMLDGYTCTVNGVALDEKATIQMATTRAKDYLPEGTTGFSTITQQVTGLMEKPEVVVTDRSGNPVEVTYDEATRTFTARSESNTMPDDVTQIALDAAHVYCKWMIEAVTDRGEVAKYYDNTSDAYTSIVKAGDLWMQKYTGYEFVNESVTNYAKYSGDIFSVTVKTDLNVTRTDGTVRTYNFNQSMFFRKGDSGKWLCFVSTNVDVSQPVGLVRLTFMNGENEVFSDLFETDTKEVITPVISVPEGQIFTGWVTVSENEKGETVYNLEFQPDATTGIVKMPEGASLRPMTLYALFEDAFNATAQIPSETAPAETAPVETTEGA